MKTAMLSIATAAAALVMTAFTSFAVAGIAENTGNSRLTLKLADGGGRLATRPEIKVIGSNGKYDHIETSDFRATLALAASPVGDDTYKIVRSRLFLKADGQGTANDGVDTLSEALPSAALKADGNYNLPIMVNGPVAQNAIAICNAVPAGERIGNAAVRRTMSLAVMWHVTTGRFAFKWTNYDRVAPSDEILRNADFYAEQITQDAEALVNADVVCAPLANAAVAAKPSAKPAAIQRVALTSTPIAQPEARASADAQNASLVDLGKPRCDGGMVRQISTSADTYLCLCPGNTMRVEAGDNAFACERRTRR